MALLAALLLAACSTTETPERSTVASSITPTAATSAPSTQEPRTLAGWRRLFASVPSPEWGAGDIGLSVRLTDGRRVWLYGDTLSDVNGFQHSTAWVQTGKSVHVANGGRQVIPNSGDTFYWPETVRVARDGSLLVTAAPVKVTGTDLFDFTRHPTRSRVARLTVTAAGDLTFVGWKGYVARPEIAGDGDDIEILGPNHYAYWTVTHDIRLADGGRLVTTSQNWDDGIDAHRNADGSIRYEDWAQILTSSR